MEILATGYNGRQNSLVYFCPPSPTQHVVFFQGDMQDRQANMMVHQAEVAPRHLVEVSRWSEWCLENTCSILRRKFPTAAIWLVRPCRMLRNLFSAFHNFVSSSMTGVPSFSTNHGAILHLHHLLANALVHVREDVSMEISIEEATTLPLILIGFSKGCVVLNQISHELFNNTNPDNDPSNHGDGEGESSKMTKPLPLTSEELIKLREVVSRIKTMYWLDSGHSGEREAWITEDRTLRELARLKIPIHVDVTPQQVRDPDRSWIGLEEAEFVAKLRTLGAEVYETLHFEHEEKSLEYHFQVLRRFKP